MPFSCLACKHPRFPTLDALRSHYDAAHTWCVTCKTPFPTASDLAAHARARPHPCTACFRCFATAAGLADHRASAPIHVQGDPDLVQRRRGWLGTSPFYGCGLCDAQYQVMHQLAHHRTVVHAGLVGDGSVRTGMGQGETSGAVRPATPAEDTPPPRPAKKRKIRKKTLVHAATHQPDTAAWPSSAHSPITDAPCLPALPPASPSTHVTAQMIPTQPPTPTPKKRHKGKHRSVEGVGEVQQGAGAGAGRKTPEMQRVDAGALMEPSTSSTGHPTSADVSFHPPSADPAAADIPTTRKRSGTSSGVVPGDDGVVSPPSVPVDSAPAATTRKRKRSKAWPEDAVPITRREVVGLPMRLASDVSITSEKSPLGDLPMVAGTDGTAGAVTSPPSAADTAPPPPPPTSGKSSKTSHAPAATLHPSPARPAARPVISAHDIADAGIFLAKVHDRLRAHPETLAQLMALFNTPERMRDVQAVYTQMKQLLACAPDLLVELSSFVAGVMRPGSQRPATTTSASTQAAQNVAMPPMSNGNAQIHTVNDVASQPEASASPRKKRKRKSDSRNDSEPTSNLSVAAFPSATAPTPTPMRLPSSSGTPEGIVADASPIHVRAAVPSVSEAKGAAQEGSASRATPPRTESKTARNSALVPPNGGSQTASHVAEADRLGHAAAPPAIRVPDVPTSINRSGPNTTRVPTTVTTSSFAATSVQATLSSSAGTGNGALGTSADKRKKSATTETRGSQRVETRANENSHGTTHNSLLLTGAPMPLGAHATGDTASPQSPTRGGSPSTQMQSTPLRPDAGVPRISFPALPNRTSPILFENTHTRQGASSPTAPTRNVAPQGSQASSIAGITAAEPNVASGTTGRNRNPASSNSDPSTSTVNNGTSQVQAGPSTPNPRKRLMPITEISSMVSPRKNAHTARSPVRPLTPPSTSPLLPKRLTGPFFCSSCDSPIETFGRLIQHLLHICTYATGSQLIEAQGYECQHCQKRFSQPWAFETHLIQEQTHMRKPVRVPGSIDGPVTLPSPSSSPAPQRDQDETATDEVICLTSPPQTPRRPTRGRPLPTSPVPPGAIPQSSPVPSSLTDLIGTEDCTIHCRQCDLDLPAVEQLVDHFSDDPHTNDTIYCYSCDETFDKPHLLWPHIFTSLRHEHAPPNTRAEFSSTQFRWDALTSGQRYSGESPIEVTGPGKTRKRRLAFQVVKARSAPSVKVEDWSMLDEPI